WWVCREQLAQGGKRTQRNEFETHQVFAAKRQRLQHLLGHREIGDIEDEDDTRTALKRVPLVDLALEVEFRRGLHLAGQDAADLLKVLARLDCSDRQNPGGRRRGRCRLSHGPRRSGDEGGCAPPPNQPAFTLRRPPWQMLHRGTHGGLLTPPILLASGYPFALKQHAECVKAPAGRLCRALAASRKRMPSGAQRVW